MHDASQSTTVERGGHRAAEKEEERETEKKTKTTVPSCVVSFQFGPKSAPIPSPDDRRNGRAAGRLTRIVRTVPGSKAGSPAATCLTCRVGDAPLGGPRCRGVTRRRRRREDLDTHTHTPHTTHTHRVTQGQSGSGSSAKWANQTPVLCLLHHTDRIARWVWLSMKYVYDACVPHVALAAVFFTAFYGRGRGRRGGGGGREALVCMPVRPSAVHCCIRPASGPLLLLLLLLLLRLGITGTVI